MKEIRIIIIVPDEDYCVNGVDLECCEYFDNEGGHPRCELSCSDGILNYDKEGRVRKLPGCLTQ